MSEGGGKKDQIFDDWPERYDQWFETPIGSLVRRYESELLLEMLRPGPGEMLLDAGCGTGVFTQDNQLLKSGEWPCSEHEGRISGVPVGSDRRIVVLGKNGDDEVVYRGEETGIVVNAGETTEVDTIVAEYFAPVLLQPGWKHR